MENNEQEIRAFFKAYEQRFNDALDGKEVDADGVVNSFSACFVESIPVGVICGKNDSSFKDIVKKGFNNYKEMGTRSMRITHMKITQLDDFHAMARIQWRAEAMKKNYSTVIIDFQVIYFLQTKEKTLKIFSYITGDEQKALQESGLMKQ